jgi:hypothetical protein
MRGMEQQSGVLLEQSPTPRGPLIQIGTYDKLMARRPPGPRPQQPSSLPRLPALSPIFSLHQQSATTPSLPSPGASPPLHQARSHGASPPRPCPRAVRVPDAKQRQYT